MDRKRIAVWVMVAGVFVIGYGLGALEPRASAQLGGSDFLLREILQELQTINRNVSSIEECVGRQGYRSYGCEIAVEVQ